MFIEPGPGNDRHEDTVEIETVQPRSSNSSAKRSTFQLKKSGERGLSSYLSTDISGLPAVVHDCASLNKCVTYGCRSRKQDPYNVSIWSPCSWDADKNLLNTEVGFQHYNFLPLPSHIALPSVLHKYKWEKKRREKKKREKKKAWEHFVSRPPLTCSRRMQQCFSPSSAPNETLVMMQGLIWLFIICIRMIPSALPSPLFSSSLHD